MKHSVKHSTNRQTRSGRGPAQMIGRSLAFVLPVVLVLSGTLAVTRVNWSGDPTNSVLTASDASAPEASSPAAARAAHEVLRDRLLAELQEEDPGVALTHLQEAVNDRPSLARHCASLARALGRAAVRVYGPTRAQSYSRPVCDTAFASGVLAAHH
ncbi:membrane protein [Streptomyces ziwulingensis]|uniref:Membrane protein n=1 Tax=Streptomyces ziwulingensis TaxID=1045501 RepID=A0ABP9AZF3_9ACTN